MSRPDASQLAAITAHDRRLLLEAGPGSGKTRTIISRIAWLIQSRQATPDQIVAVTFTNKAAAELQERLSALLPGVADDGLFVGTFHALALRLVREDARRLGLEPRFTICDEVQQDNLLRLTLAEAGFPPDDARALSDLRDAFAACKRERHDPTDCAGHEPLPPEHLLAGAYPRLAHHYRTLLDQHNQLDFDDLIYYAGLLLYRHGDVRRAWQQAHPWLFVDEFHDLDRAQYQFLQLLAPPNRPDSRVMAVADQEQRIYGWRGASEALLAAFVKDYRPRRLRLTRNYRSARQIIAACESLIERHTEGERADQGTVTWHWSRSRTEEADTLLGEIERLAGDGIPLGEMAVLYRTHRLGEQLESALAQRGLKLARIERRGFWEQPAVQEIRRYLQAALSIADEHLAAALNFPRVVADELTMIQLRRVARERGSLLVDLMRNADTIPEIGPATRRQVGDFLHLIEGELVPSVDEPLDRLHDRLFALLDTRRSPYPQAELESLRGFIAFTDVGALVTPLLEALRHGQPLAIAAAPDLDAQAAAWLLADVVGRSFPSLVSLLSRDDPLPDGALHLTVGASVPGTLALIARDAGSVRYPATLMAWRLAAALLVAAEPTAQDEVVLFDIETTGLSAYRDGIVELAALRLRGMERADAGFSELVNPGCPISPGALAVHGIGWRMVSDKPDAGSRLPDFLSYVGDAVLVGHNPEFDLRFLQAASERAGLPPLTNPVVDTLAMARRLLPEAPGHSLEALVEHLALPDCGPPHRAPNDVAYTAHLFGRLSVEQQRDQQLHLLVEYLPLVAALLLEADQQHDELGTLIEAAARWIQRRGAWPEWVMRLPAPLKPRIGGHLRGLMRWRVPPTADDGAWQELQAGWGQYVRDFQRQAGATARLEDFLAYTALIQREPDLLPDERLHLMTLHAAKGKEFRVVFLVGMEAGTLPLRKQSLDEERRVCYVGMSRAQERLYLLGCRERGKPGPFWIET